jgi:SAM-dependent methyltransferase
MNEPAAVAQAQYAVSTQNLDRRVAIHAFGTNPTSWQTFVRQHLPMRADEVVIDVGAGTGVHWQEATDARPVLTDLHAPMCVALRRLGHPVLQASAEALPLADGCADGVLCTHVLYHVPDPQLAVDEMLRVLRPGGWLAIASNGPRHMQELDALRRAAGIAVAMPHHANFDIDAVLDALTARGCTAVRHDYEDQLEVPAPEPVVDYCRSLGPGVTAAAGRELTTVLRHHIETTGHFRISKETALILART